MLEIPLPEQLYDADQEMGSATGTIELAGPDALPASPRVLRTVVDDYGQLEGQTADEHAEWRSRLLLQLAREGIGPGDADSLVDTLSLQLLGLARAAAVAYGNPDLGNKSDPVDELVYIILSRRTREGAYQAAYDALKARYDSWTQLAEAPIDEIEATIGFSGLGRRKAQSLKQALSALIDRFGSCTLEPTRAWDDEATVAYLSSLPEVGPKSAACVMMCSLDRPAFPVDAHVGRVLERLGPFQTVGIELAGKDHKAKQRLLADAVPPAIRYPLHVNLLAHGRARCLPARPRCDGCVLAAQCAARGSRRPSSC